MAEQIIKFVASIKNQTPDVFQEHFINTVTHYHPKHRDIWVDLLFLK